MQLWPSIGSDKPLEYRLHGSGSYLESAPLQRVTVAQCDQRQLEGAERQKSQGGLGERLWTSLGVD
jgi:hypothetical protein